MATFGGKLSNAQYAFAKAFEKAGLCSLSQAVKAFERREDAKIEAWKAALVAMPASGPSGHGR